MARVNLKSPHKLVHCIHELKLSTDLFVFFLLWGPPLTRTVLRLGVMTSSEVSRPDLHLGAFGGVEVAFPGVPVHTVSVREVITVEVQPVQVGSMALVVPPGAFEALGTVPTSSIVVSVFGAEGHRIVSPRQWVPRCTYVDNISLSCRPILSMCYLCTDQLETGTRRGVGVRGGGEGGRAEAGIWQNATSLGWGIWSQHQRGGDLIWCLDFMFRCA